MKLSLYSDYSLRVLMHAAVRVPQTITIDEVAEAFDISRSHLSKVVHELAGKGYLLTRRGVGGGFTLASHVSSINIGKVIRETEGNVTVIDCVNRKNRPCAIFPVCRLKGVLAEATHAFFAILDRYTLEDLMMNKTEMRELLRI